jgi:hypothetical protein
MNCIKEYENLNDEEFIVIKEQISKCDKIFEDSMMYSQAKDEKFIDKNIRLSTFRTIEEDELFQSFEILVEEINKRDKFQKYKLMKNNITHIKYEKGGYFKEHDDFQSFKSNIITEYTMILCLDSNCEGGKTIFHLNDNFKYSSDASVENKSIVIFRKDICHEGEVLTSGHKEILTANLLCIDISSKKMIVVTFPNDKRKYIINYNNICVMKDCIINSYINFNIKNETINENDDIYEYVSEFHAYEDFDVVNKILMKEYITIEEFKQNKQILDYYGISPENIFTEIISGLMKKSSLKNEIIVSEGITIFQNNDQMKHARTLLNTFNYNNNYIPMKIYFAEGTYEYGGGMSDHPHLNLKMSPIFISIGDYDNILFIKKLKTRNYEESSLSEMVEHSNKNKYLDFCQNLSSNKEFYLRDENYDDDIDENDPEYDKYIDIIGDMNYENYMFAGLKYSLKNDNMLEIMCDNQHDHVTHNKYVFDKHKKLKQENKFFNIDSENKMFFTEEQRTSIIDSLIKKDTIEKIRKSLSGVGLRLQQQKVSVDSNFCNEDIYGTFTIIEINCIINLDA